MILVDSSVWIEFLARRQSVHQKHLSALIQFPEVVRIPGPVLQEVLQGLQDEAVFRRVADDLQRFPIVHATTGTYVSAARLYRTLAAKGATIPPGDVTIAAIAIESGDELYTLDRHFHRIAQHSDLQLYQPSERSR